MEHEIRISPDGRVTAIRSNYPEEAWNAWGCFGVGDAPNGGDSGGHWVESSVVADWAPLILDPSWEPPGE